MNLPPPSEFFLAYFAICGVIFNVLLAMAIRRLWVNAMGHLSRLRATDRPPADKEQE